MMKRVLVLLLCWAIPFSALAQESEELDEALAAIFPRYRTVGAVVAVAKDGELVYHYDYGWADRGQKRPVTAETYFKIASVTKMVSAMRVMQLVEAGSLDLDAPVGDYLGYEVVNPSYPDQPITLRQLMSHTSSIHGSYTSGQQLSKMLSPKNKRRWESWKPGSRYDYSNLGAGIMGSLMEAVTGQDVNTCVDEGVFQPLGIDAAFRVSLLDAPEQAALRYNTEGSLARGRNFYLNESYDPLAGPEAHYDLTIGDVWIRGDDLCRLGMLMRHAGRCDAPPAGNRGGDVRLPAGAGQRDRGFPLRAVRAARDHAAGGSHGVRPSGAERRYPVQRVLGAGERPGVCDDNQWKQLRHGQPHRQAEPPGVCPSVG